MRRAVDVGIVELRSSYGFDDTVQRVRSLIESKGLTLFALIDHSGEAQKVGLTMNPTQLFIFGSPKAGTPVMLAAPTVAIDLPLKILVSEDERGGVWVSYNSASYLKLRHGLPEDLLSNIGAVEGLARSVVE